jgi:RNA polymerase sigma factor (sigma-70 family)
MPEVDQPDEVLLASFAGERSQAAFEELVRRHSGMVRETCLRALCSRGADADDATQIVFMLLARKAGALAHPQALAGWLYRTARKTAMHLHREHVRRSRREQHAAQTRALAVEALPVQADGLCEQLHHGIAQLTPKLQDAVVLRYLEQRSIPESARAMGCSEEAAKKRLVHGLAALRAIFARDRPMGEALWMPVLVAGVPPVGHSLLSACSTAPRATGRLSDLANQVAAPSIRMGVIIGAAAAVAVAAVVMLASSLAAADRVHRPRTEVASNPPPPQLAADPGAALMEARFQRATVTEVLNDCCVQCGLWYALPDTIDAARTLTMADQVMPLRQVLKQVAAAGGWTMELRSRGPGRPLVVYRTSGNEPALAALLTQASASTIAERRTASMSLAQWSDARAVAALARLTIDPRWEVAAVARRELVRNPGFITRLPRVGLLALLDGPERGRLAAALTDGATSLPLEALGDAVHLTATLGDDRLSRAVREHGPLDLAGDAVESLACGDEPQWSELARQLSNPAQPTNFRLCNDFMRPADQAARILSVLHDPRATQVLALGLAAAAQRHGRLGWDIGEYPDPGCCNTLLSMLQNGDMNIRNDARRALMHLHDPRALQATERPARTFTVLAKSHADDPINTPEDEIDTALLSPATSSTLIGWCRASQQGTIMTLDFYSCVEWLGRTRDPDPETARFLISLLTTAPPGNTVYDGKRPPDFMCICRALAALPITTDVVQRLERLVPDLDPGAREALALTLPARPCCGRLFLALSVAGCPEAEQGLVALGERRASAPVSDDALTRRDMRVGWCRGLGANAAPEAVAILIDLLTDADRRIRGEAARALGRIRDPMALAAVEQAFDTAWSQPGQDEVAALGANADRHGELDGLAFALANLGGAVELGRLARCAERAGIDERFAISRLNASVVQLLTADAAVLVPRDHDDIRGVLRAEYPDDPRVRARTWYAQPDDPTRAAPTPPSTLKPPAASKEF